MYESVKFQKVDKYSTVSRVGCEHCIHSKKLSEILSRDNATYPGKQQLHFQEGSEI